jgi:hypothetical protein
MRIILVIIFLTFLASGLGATEIPGPVSCEILQYKQGRLYFSAGEEALVYPHAPYAVWSPKEQDTLLTGTIEHSWVGISASFPIDTAAAGTLGDSLLVLIEPAAIDSISIITIGTDIRGLRLFSEDSSGTRLAVRSYDRRAAMDQDFQTGVLDGFVSFEIPKAVSDRQTVTEHPLPFVATLIPNVGRAGNSQGHLTTSLYYRFDHDRSPLYFDGHTSPQMCLRLPLETSTDGVDHLSKTRPYPLDPERGRRLIDNLSHRPERIRLYAGSPYLDRLAHYFGDILARDRFAVEITGNKAEADLYLEFVPISSRIPPVTTYWLQHQLVLDSVPGGLANESLRIGAGLSELIETAQQEQDYYGYLDRMSRILVTDMGVFPLFRPTLYFSAGQTLQGARFDADGFLDFRAAVKVILPQPQEVAP